MILKEIAVERFSFTCRRCDHEWVVDYDVQHVEDGRGHQCDYFFLNGLPSADPTAAEVVTCPKCQDLHVDARLTARRATPIVDTETHDVPGTRRDEERQTEREQAEHLPGHQPAS